MKPWLFIVGLTATLPAFAQHHHAHDAPAEAEPGRSSYAEMQNRAIKALSEKQVADLRAGRGMGLALSAELNGYPGPFHTLELAAPLGLGKEQKRKTQALFEQMQAEAVRLGERVIASEYELDRLFKDRQASVATVQESAAEAARTQGELRAVHLRYHLLMLDILTPAQVAKYSKLRGYN
jgi:Spy/CpxP family protein refolding chaperone